MTGFARLTIRHAPEAEHQSEVTQLTPESGSDFSGGGNPNEELPPASEPVKQPEPTAEVPPSEPKAADTAPRATEPPKDAKLTADEKAAYAKFKKDSSSYKEKEHKTQLWEELKKLPRPWFNDAWAKVWESTDVGPWAKSSDAKAGENGTTPPAAEELPPGNEVVTDERIVKCMTSSKQWFGVFKPNADPIECARFINRVPIEQFCKLLARYTASGAQMKRIVERSLYKALSFDNQKAAITAALKESVKERAPRIDTSEVKDVIWQWKGYLPLGKLVMIDGDGGLAKSMFSLGLGVSFMYASRLSTAPNLR